MPQLPRGDVFVRVIPIEDLDAIDKERLGQVLNPRRAGAEDHHAASDTLVSRASNPAHDDHIRNAPHQRASNKQLACTGKISAVPNTHEHPYEMIQPPGQARECPARKPGRRWNPYPGCRRRIQAARHEPTGEDRRGDNRGKQGNLTRQAEHECYTHTTDS